MNINHNHNNLHFQDHSNIYFNHGIHSGEAFLNSKPQNEYVHGLVNRVGGFPNNIETLAGHMPSIKQLTDVPNYKKEFGHDHIGGSLLFNNDKKRNILNSIKIPTKKFNNLRFEL